MYAMGNITCKFNQIIYYEDARTANFYFQVGDNIVLLRAFYEALDDFSRTEFFDDNSTKYMKEGCNTVIE